jgi:hypothetical protein
MLRSSPLMVVLDSPENERLAVDACTGTDNRPLSVDEEPNWSNDKFRRARLPAAPGSRVNQERRLEHREGAEKYPAAAD